MSDEPSAPDEASELPPAPDVIAFDIGEVIVDETRVWAVWADLIGVTPLTFAAVLGAAISQGGDHRDVFAHLAPNVEWESLLDEHEARLGGLGAEDLHPDVRTCLGDLRAAGLTVVLAGNQPASRTAQLQALDLGCDDIVTSEELGHEKPDPAFFEALFARLGIPAERVLYVGDRLDNDVLPASVSGARTCWLRRGPWGQLQEPPDGFVPDLSLEGLGELSELVTGWRQP
ncbi:MAG: HAD family hydrolase [Nitriliruptoraceae bacterium]